VPVREKGDCARLRVVLQALGPQRFCDFLQLSRDRFAALPIIAAGLPETTRELREKVHQYQGAIASLSLTELAVDLSSIEQRLLRDSDGDFADVVLAVASLGPALEVAIQWVLQQAPEIAPYHEGTSRR
jgi:hypothetical protein